MLDENFKRYEELRRKDDAGTITDDEYNEMFQLEQQSLYDDCLRMSQFGY